MQQHLQALKDSKYCPLWHDQDIRPEVLPSLNRDSSCELLVVGGGFTGLWGALQAKERKPDADIVLIEKTFIGDGASGRNGGFLQSHLAHGETNTEHHFPGEAERLHELGIKNLEELIASLKKYHIDARYEAVGETDVATDQASLDDLHESYLQAKENGEDVVWFDQSAMQAEVNSAKFLGGLWHKSKLNGVVDPARICWGLKRVLLELGVKIFESTGVDNITPLGQRKMKAVCGTLNIEANKVLMATNAFPNPMRKVNKKIIPIWDYQIATEPLTQEQLESIGWHKSRHALGTHLNMFHYFRMTKDNRITWGGGGAVRYYFNRGTDAKKYGDVAERFEQLSKEFFDTFPQLAGVKFSHRWSGIIATSSRFCMVPGVAYNGRVAWAVGYTGLGVGASRFGARIGIELLGYQPSDILQMQFVKGKSLTWFPEPFCWFGVRITQRALEAADKNDGKRGLWLKILDFFNLGFTC